jgi:L-ribulose-5-phosphate 4-epimerase
VAIKPSGVDYSEMIPSQMVIVDLDANVAEGDLRPSSDTPTHLELYRSFPQIGGVAHTHSTYATAWAQACRPIPCLGTTHADSFRGAVPVTEPLSADACAGDYECETGRCITRVFEQSDPHEVPAVLVAGHGPFTWGPSAAATVENSIVLEYVARMAAITEGLNPEIGPISTHLQDRHFLRKHGSDAYYGQQGR